MHKTSTATELHHCMDCGAPHGHLHHRNCASFERDVRPGHDPAAHYRHRVRARITDEDIARGFVEIKLDPYRVCDVYDTGGGPREQMVKKLLRWTDKGQSEEKVLDEIESALKRWREMRWEDALC